MNDARTATDRRTNQNLQAVTADAEARYVAANPESRRLNADAQRSMPGGNTRTTLFYSPFPLAMSGGEGATLHDADGHRYADFINEFSAGVYGHSDPTIAAAIAETLAAGIALGAPNRHEGPLADEIRWRFPSMELLRFCNSGTEANLLALATARNFTGRPAILAFNGAYHGSLAHFNRGVSPLNMPFPWVVSKYNDTGRMLADIDAHGETLAAAIVEPLQGNAGCIAGEPSFLAALRDACTRRGILLVFDEVMTSRLSPTGLQGRLAIRPDMTTLGKYIGGGITLAAFGGRSEIMQRFDPRSAGAFPHGGTFNNNVLAMAAGHAALSKVLRPEAVTRMNGLGDSLRLRVNETAHARQMPFQATGAGSLIGLHFHRGPIRSVDDIEAGEAGREQALQDLRKLFHFDMIERGQYIGRRGYASLSLRTTPAQIDALVAAIDEFLVLRGTLIREVVT